MPSTANLCLFGERGLTCTGTFAVPKDPLEELSSDCYLAGISKMSHSFAGAFSLRPWQKR